jgi:serine/threonine protein kinase
MRPIPQIPGYELLEYLGGGPMTAVYAARAGSPDDACAVKLLRHDWGDPATAIKLLQREARAGLAVRNSHLVRVLQAHVSHEPFFLVMNLLPGQSLRRRLRCDYRIPISDAIWMTRQAAEALAALHRAGFIHGDVKPDNLRLVDPANLTLIDLGFAHRPGENAGFLQAGYVLGTANYLPPELCGPEPADDYCCDLFSLGVTLFELLTGRLPYPPGSLSQTLRRHQCDPPADIRRYAPTLPPALATLVERMLAHKPTDRPRAAAVVQQLIKLEIATLRRRSA